MFPSSVMIRIGWVGGKGGRGEREREREREDSQINRMQSQISAKGFIMSSFMSHARHTSFTLE